MSHFEAPEYRRLKTSAIVTFAFALGCICGAAFGQDVPGLNILRTPAGAVHLATSDVLSLPVEVRPQMRYLWVPDAAVETHRALAFVANTALSRSHVGVHPIVTASGLLLRIDFGLLSASIEEAAELLTLWDSMAINDPYFHVRGAVDGAVAVAPLPWTGAAFLSQAMGAVSPIYRADWFADKSMRTLDGGNYYEWRGLPANIKLEEYLRRRGASEEQAATLRSDERAAMFQSQVTGKPRRITIFRGAGVRPSAGTALISVTDDPGDADVGPEFHPIRNLLQLAIRGRELIAELPNGMHEFTLWDADGNLVRSVPDDIAVDHTIPAPHTRRLEAAMSCVSCHGPDDGWRPFPNQVQSLLDAQLEAFDDLGAGSDLRNTIERLRGLYSGDLRPALMLGRMTYSQAVYEVCAADVSQVSAELVGLVHGYRYDLLDTQAVCDELGIATAVANPLVVVNRMVGQLAFGADGISPEDPVLAAIKAGIPVTRADFEQVFADLAFRVAVNGGGNGYEAASSLQFAPVGGAVSE